MPSWLDSVEETAPVQETVQAQQYEMRAPSPFERRFWERRERVFFTFDLKFEPKPEPEPEPEYVSSAASADAFVLTVETELFAATYKPLSTKTGTTISPTCHYSPHY
jgi:hypothetical protein